MHTPYFGRRELSLRIEQGQRSSVRSWYGCAPASRACSVRSPWADSSFRSPTAVWVWTPATPLRRI